MDKASKKKIGNPNNVEFGMEFGDMNASKIYEIPFKGKRIKR